MYIQVTTKCNMACAHCCFACTGSGQHMDWEVFQLAFLEAVEAQAHHITLGGGEPTLWPHFRRAIDWCNEQLKNGTRLIVVCVTNGSSEEMALYLHRMMEDWEAIRRKENYKREVFISTRLSVDEFHDLSKVSDLVLNTYGYAPIIRSLPHNWARRRNSMARVGRAKALEGEEDRLNDDCCCPIPFIKPNGDIRYCGCEDAPVVGQLGTNYDFKEHMASHSCHADVPKRKPRVGLIGSREED